tara:strand:- start:91 stop:750 length:660 start_codon:yes stop_codon:yes gene_type:complete
MKNTKILIVEDEVLIADYIYELLNDEGFNDMQLAHDETEATIAMKNFNPEIILMDINLNGVNSGIGLAKAKNKDANVIFLTSQYDYDLMSKALATNPDTYLTKPIKKHDLVAAVNLAALKKESQSFIFKNGHDEISLNYSEILYFKAEGNYVDIFTSDKKFSIRQSLNQLIEQFPETANFLRAHKSYLVNGNLITKKTTHAIYIEELEIPLGRTYSKQF